MNIRNITEAGFSPFEPGVEMTRRQKRRCFVENLGKAFHVFPSENCYSPYGGSAESKSLSTEDRFQKLIARLLENPSYEVRRVGMQEQLDYWEEQRAIEELIKALKNPDPNMRMWAACKLGRLKDQKAVKPLQDIEKNDPSYSVRAEAKLSLLLLEEAKRTESATGASNCGDSELTAIQASLIGLRLPTNTSSNDNWRGGIH